jgi:hypothetical protein
VGGPNREETLANPTGGYLALKRLWAQLPDTMRTDCDRNQVGDPALKKIIELCGLYESDYAGASGRLRMLLGVGALKARGPHDGWLELTKGAFPEPDDPRDWVEKTNERIRKKVAEEEARLGLEAKLSRDAAETLNAPFVNAKREDFKFMMQENGLDPESLAATIEAAVEKVLQAHGLLQMVNAGNGSQER